VSTELPGASPLDHAKRKFGFVPNAIREMARSPSAAWAYLRGQEAMETGLLSEAERQAVQLAASVFNECRYCGAAHLAAARHAGLSSDIASPIAAGDLPLDHRIRSLVSATWLVLDRRGHLTAEDLTGLESEGVSRAHLYEVVALIGLKTMMNYVNHMAHTEIDAVFTAAETA